MNWRIKSYWAQKSRIERTYIHILILWFCIMGQIILQTMHLVLLWHVYDSALKNYIS